MPRHGRLYDIQLPASGMPAGDGGWLSYVYVTDDRHIKSSLPASAGCDCPLCSRYSLGYLHHLFDIKDALAMRLATIHNLRMMACLSGRLREERQRGG